MHDVHIADDRNIHTFFYTSFSSGATHREATQKKKKNETDKTMLLNICLSYWFFAVLAMYAI